MGAHTGAFGSIKIAMMEFFDDHYATLSKVDVFATTAAVAIVRTRGERAF